MDTAPDLVLVVSVPLVFNRPLAPTLSVWPSPIMASKAAFKRVSIILQPSPLFFTLLNHHHLSDTALSSSSQLTKEYVAMQKEPPPFVWAAPDEKNILNCKSKYSLASLALNILLTWHLTYIGNYIIVCIFLFPHTSHVSQCGFFFMILTFLFFFLLFLPVPWYSEDPQIVRMRVVNTMVLSSFLRNIPSNPLASRCWLHQGVLFLIKRFAFPCQTFIQAHGIQHGVWRLCECCCAYCVFRLACTPLLTNIL